MTKDDVEMWVLGVLQHASMGAAHESDSDEELQAALEEIEDVNNLNGPTVIVGKDGQAFEVTVVALGHRPDLLPG
jgi:hypothetical protein